MIEIFLRKESVFYFYEEEVTANSRCSYEIESESRIGAGGNGVVYKCINQDGKEYAIKILLNFGEKSKKRFIQEIALMKRVKSNHIINYIDDGVMMLSSEKGGEPEEALFVIMELADCNLLDYLKKNKKLDYSVYVPQFRGLCEALQELHRYAIHRDIKPENILIKGDKWILSDFGLCEFLGDEEHYDLTGKFEKVGPIYWISPEAVNHFYFGTEKMGTYSDVYQLALVFAFVLLRRYPGGQFVESDDLKTTSDIRNVILKSISNNYNKRPQNGEELLKCFNLATVCE